jgi:hypothetical protein
LRRRPDIKGSLGRNDPESEIVLLELNRDDAVDVSERENLAEHVFLVLDLHCRGQRRCWYSDG